MQYLFPLRYVWLLENFMENVRKKIEENKKAKKKKIKVHKLFLYFRKIKDKIVKPISLILVFHIN